MVRNTSWRGIGVLSAVLMGVLVAGCSNQKSNPDNISGAPVTAAHTTSSGTSATASAGSFGDAANTWSRVEEARAEMDTAMKEKNLDQVHGATSKIRDLVKTLPDESAMLPQDKRKNLDAHIQNVGELAAMMDKSDDPNDMKSAQEHQIAMHESLDMMKGMYPAGTMHASMHMPNMNSAGEKMADARMPDSKGMAGKGMSGMDDKMGGMGKPTAPGMSSDPNAKPMPGGGMSDDKMSGMGGIGMMDKMMSGMSAMDKDEMKMMMDKMAAMPPAQRKKAMKKMSGMGKPTAPGMTPDPNAKPMPGGGMGGDM